MLSAGANGPLETSVPPRKTEDHKGYDVGKFLFVSLVSFVVISFCSFVGSQMEVLRQ